MTKLKNTKKGMAKKALSISLIAAMLATSNVPVWAADFSDGSSVNVQTDEVVDASALFNAPAEDDTPTTDETPFTQDNSVIEQNDAAPMLSSVVDAEDLTIDLNVSESATFAASAVEVTGSILLKDGNPLQKFKYAWRVAGQTTNIYTREITDGDVSKMGFSPDFKTTGEVEWDKYAGKTLELYIFNNEDSTDTLKIDPIKVGSTVIKKLDMSDAQLALSTYNNTLKVTYNGKDYYYGDTATGNSVTLADTAFTDAPDAAPGDGTWTKENVQKYFKISASGTARNAGEKLVVTATAKPDSPYIGTAKNVTIAVVKKDFNDAFDEGKLSLTVAAGLSYQFTGAKLAVPTDKLTLKETEALSGADLSAAIKKAYTTSAGSPANNNTELTVEVELDETELTNFSNVPATLETSSDADANKVTVTKRDLSTDCNITLGFIENDIEIPMDKIPAGTAVADLSDYLVFKAKDGTILQLTENEDYKISVKKNGTVITDYLDAIGTYEITVSAATTDGVTFTGNCINSKTITAVVSDNAMITYGYSAYETYYSGEEIKPTQSDLGAVYIYGYNNGAPLASDVYRIVGYKNNINARTETTTMAKTPAVTIEILEGKFKGNKVDILFEINPLSVTPSTITVPETVSYNKGYGAAKDYNIQAIVTAKDPSGKIVKGLSASDFDISYAYVNGAGSATAAATNELHDKIKTTITIKNTNFIGSGEIVVAEKQTEIVAKALADSMIAVNPSSYTYTGGNITPDFYVTDGAFVLYEGKDGDGKGEYQTVSVTNNLNVGTGKVVIKGINDLYSGTASATFTITAANTSDVKVEIDKEAYTGKVIRPRTFTATLNGNNVSNQFEIVGYGENINAGKGTVILKPVDGNKNFTGSNITAEFDIFKEAVEGEIAVYNSNGENVTSKYETDGTTLAKNYFDFDGAEKTFATEKLTITTKETSAKESDFEVKYAENITGVPSNIKDNDGNIFNVAYAYAIAKEGTGFTGNDQITLADGTIIKNVVAKTAFLIKNVKFGETNVSVKNATYAGGLPVKPEILVQIKGNTLVEGKDYELELTGAEAEKNNYIDVTDGKVFGVKVIGKGGYTGSEVVFTSPASWGIDKKSLNDCDVKAVSGTVTVMNGYIPVPTTEYTVKENADGTYTVTANTASKSYTGSKTVVAEGQKPTDKPAAPVIERVNVVGNKATVILSGESEGSTGYDYVISTDRNCITTKDYDKVNKNILSTNTTFTYTQQNVYYAYCHSWKRVDGKKVFSDWSNGYPFAVSAMTPDQPGITNVKVSGSTVSVTYTKSANATGYDVVLGSAVKKVNGENRPVEYGTLVKKITKGNTVTATFKNVKKGTYYAGLHAYNRTSEDGKKVFSPWSNTKKVTVK